MKIGYWLGNTSVEGGGVAPYAWRLLEILLSKSKLENLEIVVLCCIDSEQKCLALINSYQSRARVSIIPQEFSFINRAVNKFGNLIAKVFKKLNIPTKGVQYLDPWFRWFASLDIDLLHVPYQTSPFYQLSYPLVVTMHDVQELHYPEFFTPQERAWRSNAYWESLEKSSGIAVSFDHIKKDLVKYFRLAENKIYVCPPPCENIYLQPPSHDEELEYQKKYAQWDNFILYPAQTWQHKNHLSLIKAIELIKNKFGITIQLICTGKKNEGFFPTIEAYLKESNVFEQIHFMDIVPESELCWLYKNSSLVVIPTLYEAGSFPLIEAMYLQAPVICSSVTSLPDTIGDSRFIFNPLDIDKIASLIIDLLDSVELRAENIQNSRKQIDNLKNIDSASYFFDMYHKVINFQ